jgi:hypothetical protein
VKEFNTADDKRLRELRSRTGPVLDRKVFGSEPQPAGPELDEYQGDAPVLLPLCEGPAGPQGHPGPIGVRMPTQGELVEQAIETLRQQFGGLDDNPKDTIGSVKLPMHLWPFTATAEGVIALSSGTRKYGRMNWRAAPVRASIYFDALSRHLAAWFDGEDRDAEGVGHLGSALANLAILVDAREHGTLIDDRNPPGRWAAAEARLTPEVSDIRDRHADRPEPRHYTYIAPPGPRNT